ncbi:mannonate dehydratase [Sphingomonas sp. IW22]|uniref:mannonate dehydratase n=1 Tax=Sphingomonas sp. IW22 TaxID=3242489 RepID=UPI0035203F0E
MVQTMRWFGPNDPVTLRDIRQTGATGIVTALHEVPNGAVWSREAIADRKQMIHASGLEWDVVESLPVHEGIKTASNDWDALIGSYRDSLINLAANDIRVVTYNFMPLLDWTRTDLEYAMPDGALALRFDPVAVAAYDLHILKRADAAVTTDPELVDAATRYFKALTPEAVDRLERTILAGLPGSEESFDSAGFRAALSTYASIGAERLREHHVRFLRAVCPLADDLGIRLVVHPDDPPFPIFGLPRVVSTESDLAQLFAEVPNASNGLCFCTGSLGVRADNDLPGMVDRLGSRIGFLHLRSVEREPGGAFHEAAHLEGSAEMAAVVGAVHRLSRREGRRIPMRPDHGHQMLDDLNRLTNPGYSLLGRMRGLAELRGLERGIEWASDRG